MVKVFKNNVLSVFIVAAFFLSQVVNVNANHLRNSSQKEDVIDYILKQMGNPISNITGITDLYVSTVNYGVENKATVEGKIEKVIEPVTIVTGLVIATYAINLIGALTAWIKEIIFMSKKKPLSIIF
ncbi:hypothetical protein HNQ69_000654 [Bartonella callosciuri]|uniref:Uncharacterized protein n=1 Tax=Bartonella callosciuri TaxID=686223 RepID=A0A840NUB7_9HYPH|nr:hypothetical protein [Bartonella callosciuri]MBB5073533.1 hypothetical protein [Bartonella callosciuri]